MGVKQIFCNFWGGPKSYTHDTLSVSQSKTLSEIACHAALKSFSTCCKS